MMEENQNSKVLKLIDLLINKINNSEINKSLDFAYYLGEVLFHNQIPFFDIKDIEHSLIIKTYSSSDFSSIPLNKERERFLFVVTEPYITGGHTRLMENLSLMIGEEKDLLITKSMDTNVRQRLMNYFPNIYECYRNKEEESIIFINKIVENLIKYEIVILNTHPEDIFTVVACGIVKKIKKNFKVYFVNHADHAFTYGTSVADFWFEISLYGKKIDDLKNINGKRSFLGIPINKPDQVFSHSINYASLPDAINFMTAASSTKYKPSKYGSIFPLIYSILRSNNNFSINAIGVDILRNYWWWLCKLKFFNKLKLYKSLPYEDYIKVTKKADCYIDSHPFPGGTAFVEQFLNGIPCIGLKSSFFGYTPLEKIKKDSVKEVIEMLNNPPKDEEIEFIQKLIFEVHGFSQVKHRFNSTIDKGILFDNPMISHIEDQELLFYKNNNINLSVDFLTFLYRYDKFLYIKILFRLSFYSIFKSLLKHFISYLKVKIDKKN